MSEIDDTNREIIRTRSELETGVIRAIPSGQKFIYEPFKLPYRSCHEYIPDLILSNGIIIEIKGYLSPEDRRKLREIKQQYPDLDIRLVFQNARVKIFKGRDTTCGDWARKNNFKYAEKTIPISWFYEKAILDARTRTFIAKKIKENKIRQIESIENWWDDLYDLIAEEELEESYRSEAEAEEEEGELAL